MAHFGRVLFSGSRFIFWALTPVLLVFAITFPLTIVKWSTLVVVAVIALEVGSLLLVLGLYNPVRFRWALRCLTGLVFIAYVSYVGFEFFVTRSLIRIPKSSGEASPVNAILGFLIIGVPCLWYTIRGRFTRSPEDEGEELENESARPVR